MLRDIDREVKRQGLALTQKQEDTLNQAYRLLKQTRQSKNKLYSLHKRNVDCISKGKAHKRYEFGVKASIAVTVHNSVNFEHTNFSVSSFLNGVWWVGRFLLKWATSVFFAFR